MAQARLGRRSVLAGLGTAATLPFLRAVAAQAQAASGKPRLALFVSAGWFPSWSFESGTSGESSFTLGPALAPLARWSSRIRVFRGLADRPGHERQNRQNAHDGIGRWLLHGDAPDSVDNAVGEVISAGKTRRALAWAAYREKNYYRRYRGATEGGQTDPRRTWSELFAGLGGVAADLPTTERVRREARLRAIEAVEAAAGRLGERLSGAHRRQILAYLDGLGTLRAAAAAPAVAAAGCAAPEIKAVPPIASYNEPTRNPDVYPNVMRAHFDSAAAAQICGLTSATTVFISLDDNFPDTVFDFVEGIGPNPSPRMGDHGISHDARPDNEAGRRKTLAQKWYATHIARFCSQLEAVPGGAPGRTLLDETLVVYVQAFGNHAHGRLNHMALLMGDPLGELRAGVKYMHFNDQRTMSDLWATVSAALTGTRAAFGPFSKGPITDVLR